MLGDRRTNYSKLHYSSTIASQYYSITEPINPIMTHTLYHGIVVGNPNMMCLGTLWTFKSFHFVFSFTPAEVTALLGLCTQLAWRTHLQTSQHTFHVQLCLTKQLDEKGCCFHNCLSYPLIICRRQWWGFFCMSNTYFMDVQSDCTSLDSVHKGNPCSQEQVCLGVHKDLGAVAAATKVTGKAYTGNWSNFLCRTVSAVSGLLGCTLNYRLYFSPILLPLSASLSSRALLCGGQRGRCTSICGLGAPPGLRELWALRALFIRGITAPHQHPQEMAHQPCAEAELGFRWKSGKSWQADVLVRQEAAAISAFPQWNSAEASGIVRQLHHPHLRRHGETLR